jgi:hypothetical protein
MKSLVVRKNNNQPMMGGHDFVALGAFIEKLERFLLHAATNPDTASVEYAQTAAKHLAGQCMLAGYFDTKTIVCNTHLNTRITGVMVETHLSVLGGADYTVFTGDDELVDVLRMSLLR